jgi:hypothetical protein
VLPSINQLIISASIYLVEREQESVDNVGNLWKETIADDTDQTFQQEMEGFRHLLITKLVLVYLPRITATLLCSLLSRSEVREKKIRLRD